MMAAEVVVEDYEVVLEVAAVDSGAVTVAREAIGMASAEHQAERHPAREAIAETGIAASPGVTTQEEGEALTTGLVAVSGMAGDRAIVTADAVREVTWSRLDVGKVGIEKEIVTVTVTGTATGTEVEEISTDRATMTAGNVGTKEAATRTRESCGATEVMTESRASVCTSRKVVAEIPHRRGRLAGTRMAAGAPVYYTKVTLRDSARAVRERS